MNATLERPADLSSRLARTWGSHPLVAFAKHRRQIAFYRQFHALIRSGVGLPTAFAELTRYAPDPTLARGLKMVAADIRGGSTLAQALGRHSALFDDANVELIAFAEEAGTLDRVLQRLTDHLEEMNRMRWRAIFMSLWPMYLAAGFVFVGPLLNVAQTIKSSSSGVGALYAGGLFRNLLIAGATLGGVLGAPFAIAALNLELEWDRLKRRLPVVSRAIRDLYASRLMLGLGLGVGAGLEVMRTLRVAVYSTNSPSLGAGLPNAELLIRNGGTLTDAIDSLGLLDRSTLGTLAIAERTGTISETLEKLSSELQASSLRAIRVLIIVVVAVVAAVLLVSIVSSILGSVMGPVKTLYDAAGSGDLDKL